MDLNLGFKRISYGPFVLLIFVDPQSSMYRGSIEIAIEEAVVFKLVLSFYQEVLR